MDRFLEHSRIFYFENGCRPEVYLGSADWMPRNFFGRIEVVFPIEDGNLRERLANEIMSLTLADNVKARLLGPDGRHRMAPRGAPGATVRSQAEFMALARNGGVGSRKKRPAKEAAYPKVQLAPRPKGSE